MTTAIVHTKSELATALKSKTEEIIIADPDLASNVRIVKAASKAALVAVVAGAGVAATNFWNPVGWVSGAATAAVSGTLLSALVVLGLGGLVFIIYSDYEFEVSAGQSFETDGVKHAVHGALKLRKR